MNKTYLYSTAEGDRWNVQFVIDRYVRGGLYLALETSKGEPVFDITKHVAGTKLGSKEIVVKNYSENEGMDAWLVKNGIARHTNRFVNSGHVTMPIMELTDEFLEQYREHPMLEHGTD